MNPTLLTGKRARLGKIVARCVAPTPNHVASVAPYWSTEVVGIQRPSLFGVVGPAQHQLRIAP